MRVILYLISTSLLSTVENLQKSFAPRSITGVFVFHAGPCSCVSLVSVCFGYPVYWHPVSYYDAIAFGWFRLSLTALFQQIMPCFLQTGCSYVIDDFSGFSGQIRLHDLKCYVCKDTVNLIGCFPSFLFTSTLQPDHYFVFNCLSDVRFSEVQVFLVWTIVCFYLCLDLSVMLGCYVLTRWQSVIDLYVNF